MDPNAAKEPTGLKVLDVGCGWNKTPGAIGIDSNPKSHADVIHDLGVVPYPFPDNEFDQIICSHVAEHVPDVMAFVTELYRIAKPDSRITIVTPHYTNPDWPTDPTHRNHFNSYSFNCFIDDRQLFPFYTDVKLKPIRTYVSLANLWRAIGLDGPPSRLKTETARTQDWRRSTVSGPQRLQLLMRGQRRTIGHRASPRLYPKFAAELMTKYSLAS